MNCIEGSHVLSFEALPVLTKKALQYSYILSPLPFKRAPSSSSSSTVYYSPSKFRPKRNEKGNERVLHVGTLAKSAFDDEYFW